MAKKNNIGSILTHVGAAGIGYLLGSKKTTTNVFSLEGAIVSEVGDGKTATYPFFKIVGKTKVPLTSLEFEDIVVGNFSTPVTLVNKTLLDTYKTVGTIQTTE